MDQLTQLQARRIALAAQGFLDRPHATPDDAHVRRARWPAPACCRSTRSTSSSARTTCRSTRGWAPTTSTCCAAPSADAPPRRLVEYWAHVQALHAGRPVAGDAAPDGAATAPSAASGASPRDADARAAACSPRSATAGPVTARDLEDEFSTARAPRSTGAGTGPRPARSSTTSSSSGDVADRRAQQPVRGASTTCPSGCCPPRCSPRRRRRRRRRATGAGPPCRPLARRRRPARACADYYRMRLQPTPGRPAQVAIDELVEAGELIPVAVRGLEAAGVPPPRRAAAAAGGRPRAAQPVRPGGVGAGAHRGALRLPLPDRDLRPGREARARLLRAAVPARRPDRRPGRPQGRPGRPGACWSRAAYAEAGAPAGDRRGAGRPSCGGWPAGSGWTTSWSGERGDLAPHWQPLRTHPLGGVGSMIDGHRRPTSPHSPRSRITVPAIIDKLLRIGEGKILRQLEADRQGRQRHRGRLRRDERRRAPRA